MTTQCVTNDQLDPQSLTLEETLSYPYPNLKRIKMSNVHNDYRYVRKNTQSTNNKDIK